MVTKKQMINEIKRYRIGIFFGAVAGLIAASYAIQSGIADLAGLAEASKGVIDTVMTRSAPVEVGKAKLYVAFISIGTVVGYLIDRLNEKI